MGKPSVGRCLWVLAILLLHGCAQKAIILDPGPVPFADSAESAQGAAAWSLWVGDARDARGAESSGQLLGTFYSRFGGEPQAAYLAVAPEQYVREQLSRFLLHRGLEASAPGKARAFLNLDLTEFSVTETPGTVWDEVAIRIAYTVWFKTADGTDLGHVKLVGGRDIQVPVNAAKETEKAVREALGETFPPLVRSDVFQRVLQGL